MRGGWEREVGRVLRLGAQLPTLLYIYSFGGQASAPRSKTGSVFSGKREQKCEEIVQKRVG